MKVKSCVFFLLEIFLIVLPGCGCRIISWSRSVVNQGCPLPDYASRAHRYVRSTSVYNQFTLLARFDAIWLSDEVLACAQAVWGSKHGCDVKQVKEYLHKQLDEQQGLFKFYVLSLYEVPLDTQDPAWGIFLDIDGCCFVPIEITKVDLPIDYVLFFGKNYSRFKIPYLVTFDLKNCSVDPCKVSCMKLICRSATKEAELVWNLDELNERSDKLNM